MVKRFSVFIALLFFYQILIVFSLNKFDNIEDALKDYPSQVKRGKKAKYMKLKITKDKWKQIDYFSRILYQFFLSGGAKVHFVNMEDKELLGIYPEDAQIDREAVLDHFQGVVEDILLIDKL